MSMCRNRVGWHRREALRERVPWAGASHIFLPGVTIVGATTFLHCPSGGETCRAIRCSGAEFARCTGCVMSGRDVSAERDPGAFGHESESRSTVSTYGDP